MNKKTFIDKWGSSIKGAPKKALIEIYKVIVKKDITTGEALRISFKSMTFKELTMYYSKQSRVYKNLFKKEERAIEFINDLKKLAVSEVTNLI